MSTTRSTKRVSTSCDFRRASFQTCPTVGGRKRELNDPRHQAERFRIGRLEVDSCSCHSGPSTALLCGCQVMNTRVLLFSYDSFSFPDQRETCCYAWYGTGPSHLLEMRPSLRHKAPGSLSQGSNHQEFLSPGSRSRRVVPWGDVSSWVKGAE